jgi:TatD DNase family protein
VVDSHCHLADPVFAGDLDDVVARAKHAGVERALVILAAGDADEAAQGARVARLWPEVCFGVGVHPHAAGAFAQDPSDSARVVREQFGATPGACAVGEVGLDYHYDFAPREVQRDVFRAQIRLARELDRPVIVHTREADADTIDILRAEGGGVLRGVLHCFTGGPELACAALGLGLHISLAGIITFPRAGELRQTARDIPLDRLLVETDSPFLAPVPHRGTRNEPAHVTRVVAAIAELHAVDPQQVAATTRAAFRHLFGP